jgi:tetratricopeptide (TPR) repeat protein
MKRISITLAVAALLMVPAYANSQTIENKEAAEKYNQGLNLLRQGQYQEAVELLKDSAQLEPGNYRAHYALGLCYRRLRQPDQAISEFEAAANFNPNYFDAYFAMGNIYKDIKNDLDRAAQNLRRAGEVSEQVGRPKWEAYFNLGVLEFNRQNWDQALEAFGKTVQYNASNEKAFASMGRIYMERGEYETALVNFTMATQRKPDWFEPYFHKAHVLNRLGQYDEAIAEADESLKRMPNHGGSLFEKGSALASLQKWDEALRTLEQAARDAQWRQMANHQIELIKNRDKYVDIPPSSIPPAM